MAVPIPEVISEEVAVLCHASIESLVVGEFVCISTASVFVPCVFSWIRHEQSRAEQFNPTSYIDSNPQSLHILFR